MTLELEDYSGHFVATGVSQPLGDGNWHEVTGVFDRSANELMSMYIDGALSTSTSISTVVGSLTDTTACVWSPITTLGGTCSNPTLGGIPLSIRTDEYRILNGTALSSDWIKTEYNNENSPSTFETFGSESSPPVPAVPAYPVCWLDGPALISGPIQFK